MKAMILAAGRGMRMLSYTDDTPKPLLHVNGKPLIEYHLEMLAASGIQDVIINISYLGYKIREALGDGKRWGLRIRYSEEAQPLETGGAIMQALPLLGDKPFLLINADVFSDYNIAQLVGRGLKPEEQGCLMLVPNPDFKATGDFSIGENGLLAKADSKQTYTFSGISLLRPEIVSHYGLRRNVFPLVEVFQDALARKVLSASIYRGKWSDVGTPERLLALK